MVGAKPLSNRQRKAQRKTAPRPGRKAKPAGWTVILQERAEPTGLAAPVAVREDVEAIERSRAEAALAIDAQDGLAVGDAGPVDLRSAVAGEFGVHLNYDRTLPGVPMRATSRDGLIALHKSKALTADQTKAGLAFRLCYEASGKGLGSGLGNAGEGGGGSRKMAGLARSAVELHRAYLLTRLNQMERAVGGVLVDGRELHALRMIAGEGHTVREVAGSSGHARQATASALARALDAIASTLRITGQ